ncbi:hypothetical protein LA080_004555 [Diaporthe eres]|nr:hypothetical protein LA080_004555 [Diaporthe eres]
MSMSPSLLLPLSFFPDLTTETTASKLDSSLCLPDRDLLATDLRLAIRTCSLRQHDRRPRPPPLAHITTWIATSPYSFLRTQTGHSFAPT